MVQRRWKNLRTCFARELREQKLVKSGQPASKRRKYKFYDQLLFLIPTVQVRETSGNAELNVSDEELEETENLQSPPVIPSTHTTSNSMLNKKMSYEERLIHILEEKKNETAPRVDDSDTNFALSLVPMLKAIPTHQKIDAQIQILQLLKNFQNNLPPTNTLDFSRNFINYSTPLHLITGTSASMNQPPTWKQNIQLISPQTTDSVQSYVSNFSASSDGLETMNDINEHHITKLN